MINTRAIGIILRNTVAAGQVAAFLLVAVPVPTLQAAAAPAAMLQFTAGGHALGFQSGGMYAAAANHALQDERNRFAAILAELPGGVVVCNVEGQILLYNQKAQEFLAEAAPTEENRLRSAIPERICSAGLRRKFPAGRRDRRRERKKD